MLTHQAFRLVAVAFLDGIDDLGMLRDAATSLLAL
jgi:hypothetical protein